MFVHAECSKRMKSCFQCKTTLLRDFRKLSYITASVWMELTSIYAAGVNSDEQTAKSQTDSKIQLTKKPFKSRPCDDKFYWDHVITTCTCTCTCVNPASDSSPEDSTLAAAGTQAVVVKKIKPKGFKPSLQDYDKGTARSQTDSKIQLRKKPSQTRPCDGKFYWDHVISTCTSTGCYTEGGRPRDIPPWLAFPHPKFLPFSTVTYLQCGGKMHEKT